MYKKVTTPPCKTKFLSSTCLATSLQGATENASFVDIQKEGADPLSKMKRQTHVELQRVAEFCSSLLLARGLSTFSANLQDG